MIEIYCLDKGHLNFSPVSQGTLPREGDIYELNFEEQQESSIWDMWESEEYATLPGCRQASRGSQFRVEINTHLIESHEKDMKGFCKY